MSPGTYRSLDQAVAGLAELERTALARRERRVVFLVLYGQVARQIRRLVEIGAFRDTSWVAMYAVAVANQYRDAFDAHTSDARVASAWRIAFDTARRGSVLLSQDLLLGINAHLNHDLPLGLDQVSIDPRRDDRLADQMAVHDVLRSATDAMTARITTLYAPAVAEFDPGLSLFDADVSNFSVGIARESAWEAAVAMANARSEVERRAVRRLIDIRAASVARLILAPNLAPAVYHACRRTEEDRWWTFVSSFAEG